MKQTQKSYFIFIFIFLLNIPYLHSHKLYGKVAARTFSSIALFVFHESNKLIQGLEEDEGE